MKIVTASLSCLAVAATALLPATGAAASDVVIDEWPVPWENTRPRDPFVDGDGKVWFCGQAGGYVARFDPATAEFTKFDLADGAGPHNLIVDDNDNVWFAANTRPYIGRLDPASGDVTRFEMDDPVLRDPHTMVFDGAGHIWFTAQHGNGIGRLDMASGEVDAIPVPEDNARPYGIRMAPDGRPWIALFGSHHLATVDPGTLELELVELPRFEARPRRLEITADGAIWYGDYAAGFLGRYDPEAKTFDEWPLPGGEQARPYGIALDDDGRLWIAEGGVPNRLVGFDTKTREYLGVTGIPNARGSVRHMYFHQPTRSVWFGEDTNFIARAVVE